MGGSLACWLQLALLVEVVDTVHKYIQLCYKQIYIIPGLAGLVGIAGAIEEIGPQLSGVLEV